MEDGLAIPLVAFLGAFGVAPVLGVSVPFLPAGVAFGRLRASTLLWLFVVDPVSSARALWRWLRVVGWRWERLAWSRRQLL
jgi:hypothetical protein